MTPENKKDIFPKKKNNYIFLFFPYLYVDHHPLRKELEMPMDFLNRQASLSPAPAHNPGAPQERREIKK